MTGWNEAFPYAVDTISLYRNGRGISDCDWEAIIEWVDDILPGECEYFNGEFRFATERAKMLFLLRWQ